MEQRSEARLSVQCPVEVEVLGESGFRLDGELLDLSSRGMRLALRKPVPLDAALRIQVDQDLYLGEAAHCSAQAGGYLVGVSLFNVMRNARAVSEHLNRILQPR